MGCFGISLQLEIDYHSNLTVADKGLCCEGEAPNDEDAATPTQRFLWG